MHKRLAFTLLEVSVSLVLMGLLAGILLQFRHSEAPDCAATTKSQLAQVERAMHDYVIAHDRFPIPALRTAGIEDTQYGREATLAALDTAGGVTFGALPFQALGLPPSFAGDCWGNKLTYAVTTDLTDSAKFKASTAPTYDGRITLKTAATGVFNSTIAYAVISHGADALGAVKLNYSDPANTQRRWCSAGADLERANCAAAGNVIVAAEYNDGADAGTNRFDDIVIFGGKEQRVVNGSCDNSFPLGCSAGSASNDNGLASCGTTRTWHCDGANGGTNDTSCTRTYPACLNCAGVPIGWGAGCSGPFPATLHGATSAPATANTNPGFTPTSSATAVCTNGTFATPIGPCVALPPPVNGVCNNTAPLGCSAGGAPIADNGATACSTTHSWVCPGQNGGSNSPPCAYANPTCLPCGPQSLGWSAGCTASFPGAAHGATTVPVPNINPSYTGTGTATCTNGMFTASGTCTPVVPVNGACDNAVIGGCAAGAVSNDNGDTTAGHTRTWHCDGSGGGSNDTSCSFTNPNCTPSTVANGSIGAYPACTITCDSGYTLSGTTCVPSTCPATSDDGYCDGYMCHTRCNGVCVDCPGSYVIGMTFGAGCDGSLCTLPTCTPASVTNGTVAAAPACTITCDSGYTLSGSTCVANITYSECSIQFSPNGYSPPSDYVTYSCAGPGNTNCTETSRITNGCTPCENQDGGCNGYTFQTDYNYCTPLEHCYIQGAYDPGCGSYNSTGMCVAN